MMTRANSFVLLRPHNIPSLHRRDWLLSMGANSRSRNSRSNANGDWLHPDRCRLLSRLWRGTAAFRHEVETLSHSIGNRDESLSTRCRTSESEEIYMPCPLCRYFLCARWEPAGQSAHRSKWQTAIAIESWKRWPKTADLKVRPAIPRRATEETRRGRVDTMHTMESHAESTVHLNCWTVSLWKSRSKVAHLDMKISDRNASRFWYSSDSFPWNPIACPIRIYTTFQSNTKALFARDTCKQQIFNRLSPIASSKALPSRTAPETNLWRNSSMTYSADLDNFFHIIFIASARFASEKPSRLRSLPSFGKWPTIGSSQSSKANSAMACWQNASL
jgi:hypothetical protein